MSQIKDNLYFDSEGIGLTEPTITLEVFQNLAKRLTSISLINTEQKDKNSSILVMNCIDLSQREFNEKVKENIWRKSQKREKFFASDQT